jgi:hypothetical protein
VVAIRDIMDGAVEVTIGENSEQLMMETGRFILVIILVLRCHRPSTDRSRWLIHISCLATLRQH